MPGRPLKVSVFLGIVATLLIGCLSIEHTNRDSKILIVTPKKPAHVCFEYELETLKALRSGTKRIVVAVKAYKPPTINSRGFVVSLLTSEKTNRRLIASFGVHPEKAFDTLSPDSKDPEHRFLISLAGYPALLGDKKTCLEVGFEITEPKPLDGFASIEIKLIDISQ